MNKKKEHIIDNVLVFTDGSCISNGYDDASGGYGIHFPNKELDDVSEAFTKEPITNQRAELYAIYVALKNIIRNINFNKVTVYTDSSYAIKCFTEWIVDWEKNNWMNSKNLPVKNKDIIKVVRKILLKYEGKVDFVHVRSHTGAQTFEAKCNDIADKLACKGTAKCKTMLLNDRKDILYIDTNLEDDNLKNLDTVELKEIVLTKPKGETHKKQLNKLKFNTETYGNK